MKSVVTALCIAAVMIVSGIAHEIHIKRVSEELLSINERVMRAVEDENYTSAGYILEKENDFIQGQKTLLSITDNHEVLEKIEMSARELRGYIDGGHKTDAMSKCRIIAFLFEHLPENHTLKLDNIL